MRRILYLNEEGQIAGAENSLILLARHLNHARFMPLVACPDGPLAGRLGAVGITHIPFIFHMRKLKTGTPFVTQRRYPDPIAALRKVQEGLKLAGIVRRYRIDLMHTNSLSAHIAGLVAARLTAIPIIWHIRQFWPRLMYRVPQPDRLVFISEAVRRDAYQGGPPPQARVIYNAEDYTIYDPDSGKHRDLRAELGIAHRQPIAVTVGRLDPIKGLDDLLRAWQLVTAQQPAAKLLIVGDELTVHGLGIGGTYRHKLEQLTEQLGIANNVLFAGWRQDIADLLVTADIFVFASRGDTSGRSVIEAMAMKKPVIAVEAGGVPELFVDHVSGMLVPLNDISALAQAIIQLIDNPGLRESLGRAARERVLRLFTIERHVAQIQALYDELLSD
jgi:L-malate glycosyltransferase